MTSAHSHAAILVTTLLLFASSCSRDVGIQQFEGTTMGTTYQVTYASDGPPIEAMQTRVEGLLEEINESLSTYLADSRISGINASTDPATWQRIDRHFETVFDRSKIIYELSGGAFNPAVAPLVNAWGFGPERVTERPGESEIAHLLELVDFDAFLKRGPPPAIQKRLPGAQLDFSAIAKGYGVDAVGELLEDQGVGSYFVEIGGEVRTRGEHPDGRPWRVGIERPVDDFPQPAEIQTVVALTDSALATSGNYRNYFLEDGRKVVHILNPATGYPESTSLLSASVLAGDAMTADAYATAFMVMGLDAALEFVESQPQLEAYFIAAGNDGGYVEVRSSGFP